MESKIKKYPVSVNNIKCIGPCYPKGTTITHPITLQLITNHTISFCPTDAWYDEKNKRTRFEAECYLTDKYEQHSPEFSITDPTFQFNCDQFLKLYYDIYTFEDASDWVSTNTYYPILSLLRIIDCAWSVYGYSITIISEQLIDFYIMVIKKKWINDIYPKISKYLFTSTNKISFKENTGDSEKHKIEKINFFMQKIITRQFIYKILQSYIDIHKSNWDDIGSHNKTIKDYLIKNIINKIKITINDSVDFDDTP